jgi:hypothetical protein
VGHTRSKDWCGVGSDLLKLAVNDDDVTQQGLGWCGFWSGEAGNHFAQQDLVW